jgi:hypothetical protein
MRDYLAIPAVVKDALFPNPKVIEERLNFNRIDPVNEENLYRWINSQKDSPKGFDVFNDNLKLDSNVPYFIHVDLAIVEDASAMAMVHRDQRTNMYVCDFMLAVESAKTKGKRIPIGKLKHLAIYLKYNMNFNVVLVTYDGWQSAESIQELLTNNIEAKVQSVDRTNAPYDTLRDIIHSGQLDFYDYRSEPFKGKYRSLIKELLNLSKDNKRNKVDHISGGSKDISDALCGAVYGCVENEYMYRGASAFSDSNMEYDSDTSDPYSYDEDVNDSISEDTFDSFEDLSSNSNDDF